MNRLYKYLFALSLLLLAFLANPDKALADSATIENANKG